VGIGVVRLGSVDPGRVLADVNGVEALEALLLAVVGWRWKNDRGGYLH